MAIPDTGADENAISLEIVAKLRLEVEDSDEKIFRLVNGMTVRCCGRARARCGFGTTSHFGPSGLHCTFYVFRTLASPLVMCRRFLEETQTLTKYRHRLVALARSVLWIPKIRTLGETQERLLCSLDGENVEVLPDSGSEVDVMSHSYALRRGFSMESTQRWIMLADGSIEKTCGLVVAQLTVGYGAKKLQLGAKNTVALSNYELGHEEDVIQTLPPPIGFTSANSNQLIKRPPDKEKGERVYRNVIESEFHILKGLTVDVLVGAGSLESLEVYTHHSKDLIVRQSQNPSMAQLNRIILLGTVEQKLRQISRTWLMWGPRDNVTAAQNIPFEQYLSEADQRENARREMARENLRMLTGNERRNAETEESTRQANYDQYRAMLLQAFEAARTTP